MRTNYFPVFLGVSVNELIYHTVLFCPHWYCLWSFLANSVSTQASTGSFTNTDVSEMPLIRWGLVNPCRRNLNAIACVFSGYHAVRRHFKTINQLFEYNQQELSSAQLCCAGSVFADTFKVEAGKLGISCRKFSLQSFLDFMHVHDSGICATLHSITRIEVVSVDGASCNSQTDKQ